MNPLKDILPGAVRKKLYVVYVLAGVLIGATQVAIESDPDWLSKCFNVWGYLGIALGLTAASNIGPTSEEVAEEEEAESTEIDLHGDEPE